MKWQNTSLSVVPFGVEYGAAEDVMAVVVMVVVVVMVMVVAGEGAGQARALVNGARSPIRAGRRSGYSMVRVTSCCETGGGLGSVMRNARCEMLDAR